MSLVNGHFHELGDNPYKDQTKVDFNPLWAETWTPLMNNINIKSASACPVRSQTDHHKPDMIGWCYGELIEAECDAYRRR